MGFAMIITVNISIADLAEQKRSFLWSKPSCCSKCSHSLWGHGHVFSNGLFLKRYRCNGCRNVVTLKPAGRWSRYRSTVSEIYQSLYHRLTAHRSIDFSRRSRENHWLRKFISFLRMLYGNSVVETLRLHDALNFFYIKGITFLS